MTTIPAAVRSEIGQLELSVVPHPDRFARGVLRADLWETQAVIMRAVAANPLVAVKACHASGKTFMAARLALWWLIRWMERGRVRVITTAPTLRQVKLMWEEIRTAADNSRLKFPECGSLALRISDECYAMGFSSSRGVNAQGFHGDHVLIIADEAPGIEPDLWDAIEGIRAGGDVRILMLGNPVVPSGPFFDTFTRERAAWKCFTISAFDTPNLAGLDIEALRGMDTAALAIAEKPFLVTRSWVREKMTRWGVGHPKFRARVLGEFPAQSEYAVFELAWIEKAKREPTAQELKEAEGHYIQVGIDVAGAGGDETALVARVDGMIIHQESWRDADPRGAVVRVLGALKGHPRYRLGYVVVDIVGVGYGFGLHLRDQGFSVFGFQAGARAIDPTRFANSKAEAYFTAREYFREGLLCDLADEDTEAQLSTINYRETSRGLTEIESKDDAKRRGLPSPDRAEALIMSLANIPHSVTVVLNPHS
jgi:hypothetical protein